VGSVKDPPRSGRWIFRGILLIAVIFWSVVLAGIAWVAIHFINLLQMGT